MECDEIDEYVRVQGFRIERDITKICSYRPKTNTMPTLEARDAVVMVGEYINL